MPKALDRSVHSAPKTHPLFTFFLHFSVITLAKTALISGKDMFKDMLLFDCTSTFLGTFGKILIGL